MTTLFPRGYGGLPSYQFSSPTQINTQYYNGRYPKREAFFAPRYPTQPLYQPPLRLNEGYSASALNPFQQPGPTTQLVNKFNQLDQRYRQEEYARQLDKMRKQYWKNQTYTLPPPMYAPPPPMYAPPPPPSAFPPLGTTTNLDPFVVYQYEKETKYIPFPVPIGGMGAGGLNFGLPSIGLPNIGAGLGGGGMSLPPKIRVIFIPTGQSFAQQPYTGSLAMPPFLYNRIAQPFASFPLPPPLPQIGSLPLTPAVQQMVSQRYSNPVAVLPFTPSCQMPQLMMSGYSLMPQQQQQPMFSVPSLPSFPPVSQAYIPPPPMPLASMAAFQSLPPAPQAFIPPAPQAYIPPPAPQAYIPPSAPQAYIPPPAPQVYIPPAPQAYIPPPAPQAYLPPPAQQAYIPPPAPQVYIPPAPQTYIPPPAPQAYLPPVPPAYGPPPPPPPAVYLPSPMSAFQSVPSNFQAYIPPPPSFMPPNIPVLSPPSLQLPLPDANLVYSSLQSSYGGYPSICRACPPAPPPLNITVSGHCWIQHCCACHQVPTPISNPNVRPNSGRITPLLRHPTVPQYVPEPINQQQYFYSNAPTMMRPWLRKTPPLPPGCIVVSDEYVNRNGRSHRQHRHSKRRSQDNYRRSTTVTSKSPRNSSPTIGRKNHRSVSPRRTDRSNNNSPKNQQPVKSASVSSAKSSTTSTSGLSAEYDKTTFNPSNIRQNPIPSQLTRESRNINFQYKYQPQELPTVYLLNRYLKSSSESSTLSSIAETQSDHSSPSVKGNTPISTLSNKSNSIKEETNSKKEDDHSLRSPSQQQTPKERIIIIREFRTNSPSTVSTISSNMEFSIVNKDDDSMSTTSTIKAYKSDDEDALHRKIF